MTSVKPKSVRSRIRQLKPGQSEKFTLLQYEYVRVVAYEMGRRMRLKYSLETLNATEQVRVYVNPDKTREAYGEDRLSEPPFKPV